MEDLFLIVAITESMDRYYFAFKDKPDFDHHEWACRKVMEEEGEDDYEFYKHTTSVTWFWVNYYE